MHDTQTNDKATTANNWKTPGATFSGCYSSLRTEENTAALAAEVQSGLLK